MAITFQQFFNKYNGGGYDVDGVAGNQCVDLFKLHRKECADDPNYLQALGGDGYAHQIGYRFDALGLNKYYNKITSGYAYGDVLVYKVSPSTPYSHVGFFIASNGNGYHRCWGMNQGAANALANTINLPDSSILCGLRLKGKGWNPNGIVKVGSIVRDPHCGFEGKATQVDKANNKCLVAGVWLDCTPLEVYE